MSNASKLYTLTSEATADRLRGLLTTEIPPQTGGALNLRVHQPPSVIVESRVLPYKRRMWSPAGVDEWCAERQPPRIRKALACLARLESAEAKYAANPGLTAGGWVQEVLAEVLAAGDEP